MQVTHNNGIEEEEENLLSRLFFKYIRYWALFLTLLIGFGTLAWAYLHFLAVPVYDVSASIMVKDEKKGLDDTSLMTQLDLFSSKKLVENEIEVIQSRMLMRQVVKKLSLYAPVTYEDNLKNLSGYVSSPIIVQARNPDSLIIQQKVKKTYFSYDSAKRMVNIDGKQIPLNTWFKDTLGEVRFISNPNYTPLGEVRPYFFSLMSVKETADKILEGVKAVQASKLSSVINMTLKDAVPKRGEDILNNLIGVYNWASINDKNALATNTLKFINQRLALIATELDSVELGIQKFKTSQGIMDISSAGQLYLNNVGSNDQKLSEINVQLAVMDQVEKYILSKNDQPGIVPATFGINDPTLSALMDKLSALEIQYQGLQKTTAANNPVIIALRNQINGLKPGILENIQNQRLNIEAVRQNLIGTSNEYSSVLKALPEKERRLIQISRQQVIKNGIYSFLLQKREETALSYNSAIADTRLVDSADSSVKPVSPKRTVIYLIALIAAIGVGAAYIETLQMMNQNIDSRKEVEHYTSVPIIGEIKYETAENPLVVGEGIRSSIAEQFRQLRTTLSYLGINSQKKRILITSTISGEGKSFIASNLALTLALTSKKVVLIELDLRKPVLSKLFKVSKEIGITDYFTGTKDADHIIKRTDANKNMFLIPSGAVPPNPSELILNGRLPELLDYLDTIFDYIIVDSAPVNPVTDAYIISGYCNASLYIIRPGVTPKMAVKLLDENTKMRTLKNMAIVLNGIKKEGPARMDYGEAYFDDGKKNSRSRKQSV